MASTRVGTAIDWRLLAAVGALALALGGMVAATSDGVQWSRSAGVSTISTHAATHHDVGADHARPGEQPNRRSAVPPEVSGGHGWSLLALALYGLVAAALAITLAACLRLVVLRRRRDAPDTRPADPPDDLPDEAVEADLQEVLRTRMVALERGSPRNAIVAAWVELEDFARSHGWPHPVTDTPAEFVHRALSAYALPAADLERLADLYREARFSTHEVTEPHREQARECLAHLLVAGVRS